MDNSIQRNTIRMPTGRRVPGEFTMRNQPENQILYDSEPMTEFSDSELQIPMSRRVPGSGAYSANASGPYQAMAPAPRTQDPYHQMASAPRTPGGPYKPMAPVPRTPGPGSYQPMVPTPRTPSPFHQPAMGPYQPMVLDPYQAMTPYQSTHNQQMPQSFYQLTPQHHMSNKMTQSLAPQRFSPYPPSNSPATLRSPNSDQTFVMRSATASSQRYPALKASTSKPAKASQGAKTNKSSSARIPRFFVGAIDQVLRWHKMAKEADISVIYRVAGIVDNMTRGKWDEYIMILRSPEEYGLQTLQLVFYPVDRALPSSVLNGQLISCVGRMVGEKKLQIFMIETITSSDLIGIKRLSFLCQRSLQEACLAANEP